MANLLAGSAGVKVGGALVFEIFPVLLAGGKGTRLWPLSREINPKHILNLTGSGSLLQQAALRAKKIAPPERIITVTTEAQFHSVHGQLSELDPALTNNILVEPVLRNTAAAITVSAFYAKECAEEAILLVTPTDHAIEDKKLVDQTFERAIHIASFNRIVTLGIKPERAETGYGYIHQGQESELFEGAFEIESFTEKPDPAKARHLAARSDVYWNSGIFASSAKTILREVYSFEPELFLMARRAFSQRHTDNNITRFTPEDYLDIPSISIDKAVMERSDKIVLTPVDLEWSDMGSWQKLWEISSRNENGTSVVGDVISKACRNSLLRSESRLLACVGLENIAVVETADAVLVANKSCDDGISSIVTQLASLNRSETTRHLTEQRPWGFFTVLIEQPGFKVKELVIRPGGKLSLQSHHHRTEHWVIVEGCACVTLGEVQELLSSNQSTCILPNVRHRLENAGTSTLKVIEVQCGNYLGEDDIERHDDSIGEFVTNNS